MNIILPSSYMFSFSPFIIYSLWIWIFHGHPPYSRVPAKGNIKTNNVEYNKQDHLTAIFMGLKIINSNAILNYSFCTENCSHCERTRTYFHPHEICITYEYCRRPAAPCGTPPNRLILILKVHFAIIVAHINFRQGYLRTK